MLIWGSSKLASPGGIVLWTFSSSVINSALFTCRGSVQSGSRAQVLRLAYRLSNRGQGSFSRGKSTPSASIGKVSFLAPLVRGAPKTPPCRPPTCSVLVPGREEIQGPKYAVHRTDKIRAPLVCMAKEMSQPISLQFDQWVS